MTTIANMHRHEAGKTPGRTRLSAAERRETILRAATEVFAQSGYRAGKVSDVAARVGVTEPVIFQNFGSKAALFAAVLERAAENVRASLDDVPAEFGSASALLAHVFDPAAHIQPSHTSNPAGAPSRSSSHAGAAYGVLFADALALTAEPQLSELAQRTLGAIAAHLADIIQRAQAQGGVLRHADPEAAAWLLLSVLSARRLRSVAMPARLEPAVTALALGAIAQ